MTEAVRTDWRRVGVFLAIAVGGAWVVGLLLWQLARSLPPAWSPLLAALLAVAYMPLPLVAGLVTERLAGRRALAVRAWQDVRRHPRRLLAILAAGALPVLVVVLLAFGLGAVAALLGVPGAGELVVTQTQLAERLDALSPVPLPPEAAAALPPVGVLLAITLLQGTLAGATINTLFAFGEEYGWRGVLAEELAPLGRLRAHTLIGVVWGLWHAPLIILLGHNFGEQWRWGVWAMVALCVPLGFVLAWAAERAGVFAAAVGHGVFNGTVGAAAFLFAGASPLVQAPGVLLALAAAAVAVGVWSVASVGRQVASPYRRSPASPRPGTM